MPEGPEVRRSADQLSSRLLNKRIVNAFVGRTGRYVEHPPDGFKEFVKELEERGPCKVTEVTCKGKFMWWTLDFARRMVGPERGEQPWHLWITYGMSGQWSPEETKHAGFGIYYSDTGATQDAEGHFIQPPSLYFNDQRHFGTLKFVHSDEQHQKKLATLGPDMLSAPPEPIDFVNCLLQKSDKTLAEVLMDQSVISGVGNYIKAESLYLAELSPHRAVSSLTAVELIQLRQQIINVMRASYNTGGATIRTYRNPDGSEGEAQRRFCVYNHKTDPLGNPVVKEETLDGRVTHWVPSVQR